MVECTESARQYPFTLMTTGRLTSSVTQVNKLIGKIFVLRLAFGPLPRLALLWTPALLLISLDIRFVSFLLEIVFHTGMK